MPVGTRRGIKGDTMVNLRHAIVWASAGNYLTIAISFASVLVMARLLTPAEFGVVPLAAGIMSIAEAIREVAGTAYLVREQDLTRDKVRSTTTLSALVTVVVTALILLTAEPLAEFFAMPMLAPYLKIAVFGYMLGPFIHPQIALFTRELQLNRVAIINVCMACISAVVAILLASQGFGALCYAWAAVVVAIATAFLCLALGGDASIYRPSLKHWRGVLSFGAYSSLTAICGKINETLPIIILGKFLSVEALAIGQRAIVLTLLPERIILAAVGAVTLPELSRRAREGEDLKAPYLTAFSYISVVQWPAMTLMALLAEPIVLLLLGGQWMDAAPLVRILCPAFMLTVPVALQYPTMVAVGAIHRLPRLLVLQTLVLAAVILVSAPFGLHAAAWSMYIALPIFVGLSLFTVQKEVGFRWRDLWVTAGKNAIVTIASAAVPLGIAIASASSHMSYLSAALAVVFSAAGWLLGLYVLGHPFWDEVLRTISAVSRLISPRQLRPRR